MGTLSFGEDQKEVNRSHDAIKECDQSIVEDTVPELTNRTTTREQSHQQCRVAEKEMKGSRDRLCRELQSISSQANPPAFPNRPSTWTSDEVKKFFDAIRAIQSWATEYSATFEPAKQKCDNSTLDHEAHRSSCNKLQTAFETGFCDDNSASTNRCTAYETCRGKALEAQSVVHEAVARVEAARKAEFTSARHVQCYLRVLNAEVSEQVDQFNICKNAAISTDHLDITYSSAPDAIECDDAGVGQAPCDEEFLSAHYTSKEWYDEAPTETCSSCSEEEPAFGAQTPSAPEGPDSLPSGPAGPVSGGEEEEEEEEPTRPCCLGLTAECLACAADQTEEEYCAENPEIAGCLPCCRALTAECLACASNQTEHEYCTENPETAGCPRACCEALTAECLACEAGQTEEEYCDASPDTMGC